MSSPKIYQVANLQSSLSDRVLKAGDTMTGNLNVAATLITQNVIPDANVTYDLGTSTARFKDLWLSNSTIYLGEASISAQGGNVSFGNAEIQLSNVTTKLNVTNDLFVSGNVGIGTVSPSAKLSVDGSAIFNESGADVDFRVESDTVENALFVQGSDGYVGIGTNAPSYPFHVVGSGDTVAAVTGGATSVAALNLGNSTNLADGGIRYDNNTDALIFRANNGEKARIDSSGNLGLGVTPSAWQSVRKALQIGGHVSLVGNATGSGFLFLGNNFYLDADGNSKYINSAAAGRYDIASDGAHRWYTAASGTADANISFTQALSLTSSGDVGIGSTAPASKLDVVGNARFYSDGGNVDVQINRQNNSIYNPTLTMWSAYSATNVSQQWSIDVNGPSYSFLGGLRFIDSNASNAERARIDASGNLGIGTTSPGQKLTVSGNASFSGGATFGGNLISNFQIMDYQTSIIKPSSGSYGGFTLNTFDNEGAGYILMRDGGDADVYRQYGLTVVTDRGPLTLAARGATIGDNSTRNFIQFMTAGGVGSAQVRMTINKDGHVTMPAQPRFYAYGNEGSTHVSGSTVRFTRTLVNTGSYYSSSTGRFTAPVSGDYYFFWGHIGSTPGDVYRFNLQKNGANFADGEIQLRIDTFASGDEYGTNASRGAIISLAAGDYATIFFASDSGTSFYPGSDTNALAFIHFGGYLLG